MDDVVSASRTDAEPEPVLELDTDYELAMEPSVPEVAPAKPKPKATVPPAPVAPPVHAKVPPAKTPVKPPEPAISTKDFLADLAAELNEFGLTPDMPPSSPSAVPVNGDVAPVALTPSEVSAAASSPQEFGDPLKDVFDEFRAELGEMGSEKEDLETHYNLGIAFREMGLLEEAISEFQMVAKESDRGRAFRYSMQCCTLLGLSFMDKGQANIAAIWYERALQTPNLDPDAVMALRYDLGVAQETSGDQTAALRSFSQVYALNIDYRDVADRIAVLQKSR